MNGVFVTGTDTGVGKTVLVAAICAVTGAQPMKPVQTGSTFADDLAFVESVTGRVVPAAIACPYRFEEPLAPSVAAARAGVAIDVARIARAYHTLRAEGPVAVEGAGGLLVEIAPGFTMADLATELELPVVIACRPGLGTLNHAALTVEAARARKLDVLGLVIVGWPADPDLASRTNPHRLSILAPLAGVIPWIEGVDTERGLPQSLAEIAASALAASLGGTFDQAAFLAGLAQP